MRVVIAGGHGRIALLLERRLAAAGHTALGIIRKSEQTTDVVAAGAHAMVLDLETASSEQVTNVLRGNDAVVFAAGAGPGSGAGRKDTVDRAAAVLMADAAEKAGVRSFVQVSALGAGAPPVSGRDEVWAAYIAAKGAAEADLRARDGLDWVIVRPGMLTDDPGTGRVELLAGDGVVSRGAIPRDDVAAVIVALLEHRAVQHTTLELVGGPTPIMDAVLRLIAS